MDLQNVKNITIPEGSVKTIHDSQNRLLWGAVEYNTTYRGDTTQQSYSGKNLFSSTIIIGGWSSTGTAISSDKRFKSQNKIVVAGETEYTISGMPKDSSKTLNITVQTYDSNDSIISQLPSSNTWGSVPYTFTTPSNCVAITISGRYSDDTSLGTLGQTTDVFQNAQLEAGSTATSYEPYVGGIPAPNPGYPQPINVVTGTQTITVTDGNTSQAFTVNLGTIELCKLGDIQDYIYKNAGSWFVYKATGKTVLDGSSDESWIRQSSSTTPPENRWFQYTVSDMSTSLSPLEINSSVFANEFATTYPTGINYTTTVEGFFIMNTSGQLRVRWDMATILSLANWRTWLSNNPIILYYPLATTSDTQITDSTLISQLDAIHQWLIRYGYNATVSGNLPLIINRTNL